jgi:hypothetical protein
VIETLMFFSLGFLSASLFTLAIIPFVHNRAERLTINSLEASIPISIAAVHASKDILRAEFAMSTRRLELTIEDLRSKVMAYARELSKKAATVNRLQSGLHSKTARQGGTSPHLTGDKPSIGIGWLREAEDILAEKEAEVAKLNTELDERSRTVDAQRVELVALKIQVDAFTRQLADIGKHRIQEQIGVAGRRGVLRLAG